MSAQATATEPLKLELADAHHQKGCPKLRIERFESPRPPTRAGAETIMVEVTRCIDCGGQVTVPTDKVYNPADPAYN